MAETPIYPTEAEIAILVLGKGRAKLWPAVAGILERSGLPRVDALMGGRHWPSVRDFLERRHRGHIPDAGEPGGQQDEDWSWDRAPQKSRQISRRRA